MLSEDVLATIAREIHDCTRCDLYQHATMSVPGSGNPHAEVMLIGEAPSAYDNKRGYPFSGPTGPFLDELLGLAHLQRGEVYLTNIVKHWVSEGRSPLPAEIAACAPYLTRQIEAVDPLLICTLGRFALARFFPKGTITALHGQAKIVGGRVVLAMYNPAAALHREELRQTVVDDFTHALPAALAEARRLAAEGKLGQSAANESDEPPQQMTLF
ncbi:MAG TPA: uracil-DNA glycosylase [Ktedonobacterales bacterium]|nr:uracil-DNA glycosylase [Ktedonobacterales bacterium]